MVIGLRLLLNLSFYCSSTIPYLKPNFFHLVHPNSSPGCFQAGRSEDWRGHFIGYLRQPLPCWRAITLIAFRKAWPNRLYVSSTDAPTRLESAARNCLEPKLLVLFASSTVFSINRRSRPWIINAVRNLTNVAWQKVAVHNQGNLLPTATAYPLSTLQSLRHPTVGSL